MADADLIRAARAALLGTSLGGAAELAHVQSASSPTGESIAPRRIADVLADLAALEAYDAERTTDGGLAIRSVSVRRPYRA